MSSRMSVFRRVAAANMTTSETEPEGDPRVAAFKTLLAAITARLEIPTLDSRLQHFQP